MEFNELLGMRGSVESVKAFTTATSDDYRGAYQRHSEKKPRTCVFVGTTNGTEFLSDRTGNRRFLPIECGVIPIKKSLFGDEKALQAEFIQSWAEAYQIYRSGKFSLVLSKSMSDEVQKMQEQFKEDDPMVGIIQGWLDASNCEYVCNVQIAADVFKEDNPDRRLLNQITDIMNNSIKGWARKGTHRFGDFGKQRCYVKTDDFVPYDDSEQPFK